VKIQQAQKTRGLLNVFVVYDYTNNRMFTHTAISKRMNGKQLLDFIRRRVGFLYNYNVKRIFLVLDITYSYT
jgi:hypothetical protein